VIAHESRPALRGNASPSAILWLPRPVLADSARGESKMPSLSESSATRSWPQVGFSRAMRTINSRISWGTGGLPGRDFQRQNSRKPFRCQPSRVPGFTTIRAFFQSNSRDHSTKLHRAASVSGRGLILCSP
jgi:hypothetical protein